MNKDYKWNPMVPELSVTHFKHSLEFYTTILGFTIQFQRCDPDFAYLDLHYVQLMIEQLHDRSWDSGSNECPLGRGINFQIEVPNVLQIYNRIEQAGIIPYRELTESWYDVDGSQSGQKEFLVHDPDGYLLRFCEYRGEKPH